MKNVKEKLKKILIPTSRALIVILILGAGVLIFFGDEIASHIPKSESPEFIACKNAAYDEYGKFFPGHPMKDWSMKRESFEADLEQANATLDARMNECLKNYSRSWRRLKELEIEELPIKEVSPIASPVNTPTLQPTTTTMPLSATPLPARKTTVPVSSPIYFPQPIFGQPLNSNGSEESQQKKNIENICTHSGGHMFFGECVY